MGHFPAMATNFPDNFKDKHRLGTLYQIFKIQLLSTGSTDVISVKNSIYIKSFCYKYLIRFDKDIPKIFLCINNTQDEGNFPNPETTTSGNLAAVSLQ